MFIWYSCPLITGSQEHHLVSALTDLHRFSTSTTGKCPFKGTKQPCKIYEGIPADSRNQCSKVGLSNQEFLMALVLPQKNDGIFFDVPANHVG